jgi:predicted CoA-binding protein
MPGRPRPCEPRKIGVLQPRSLQYVVMSSSLQPDPIADLLKRCKTIAVVGLSNSPLRPSHGVSAYMQTHGYRIIPVNPKIGEALGEKAYASLLQVPEKIDIVNIFRRPEFVEEVVDQAIQLKVPAIWMQEEVINEKAAEKARQAGIFVLMDCCILKEHKARFG